MEGQERLLTQREVAALFRVDVKTVRRWRLAGKLTEVRTPGGHPRYREAEVRALAHQEGTGDGLRLLVAGPLVSALVIE